MSQHDDGDEYGPGGSGGYNHGDDDDDGSDDDDDLNVSEEERAQIERWDTGRPNQSQHVLSKNIEIETRAKKVWKNEIEKQVKN